MILPVLTSLWSFQSPQMDHLELEVNWLMVDDPRDPYKGYELWPVMCDLVNKLFSPVTFYFHFHSNPWHRWTNFTATLHVPDLVQPFTYNTTFPYNLIPSIEYSFLYQLKEKVLPTELENISAEP